MAMCESASILELHELPDLIPCGITIPLPQDHFGSVAPKVAYFNKMSFSNGIYKYVKRLLMTPVLMWNPVDPYLVRSMSTLRDGPLRLLQYHARPSTK